MHFALTHLYSCPWLHELYPELLSTVGYGYMHFVLTTTTAGDGHVNFFGWLCLDGFFPCSPIWIIITMCSVLFIGQL